MQIPILNGIYTDTAPDVRTAYPVNLMPVPKQSGVSNGYLRPVDGLVSFAAGDGGDRGGINWNGACYRVSGTKLVRVNANGTVDILGDVGPGAPVSMDYSFDYLAVASGGRLYLWNGTVLQQVTDPDLGTCVDVVWVDGYFMSTDGEFLIVTELNNPFAIDPLKYGSSEVDPDPVLGLLKVRDEVYALNRYTIEVFDNVGGENFPFERIDGAQIQKGALGTHTACIFADAIAFLGSGRNEAPSIYLGANGNAQPLATREIDEVLAQYSEATLAGAILEARSDKGHQHLWVRLPDRTLVYDLAASQLVEEPVWFTLTSGLEGFAAYPAAFLVRCYDRWLFGNPASSQIGALDDTVSTQFGADAQWEFSTSILYNEGNGAIIHELELVALTGSVAADDDPTICTSFTVDGQTWSQERYIQAGRRGQRAKRLVWLQQGWMDHWRVQRFRGDSRAHLSFLRLEARVEGLVT
jgi:hypothetical protein